MASLWLARDKYNFLCLIWHQLTANICHRTARWTSYRHCIRDWPYTYLWKWEMTWSYYGTNCFHDLAIGDEMGTSICTWICAAPSIVVRVSGHQWTRRWHYPFCLNEISFTVIHMVSGSRDPKWTFLGRITIVIFFSMASFIRRSRDRLLDICPASCRVGSNSLWNPFLVAFIHETLEEYINPLIRFAHH